MKLWRNLAVATIGLAMLAGCGEDTDSTTAGAEVEASADTTPVDTTPADTTPADTTPPDTEVPDTTAPVDDCVIDAEGHGPDCVPAEGAERPPVVPPTDECDPAVTPYCGDEGLGGPADLRYIEGWGVDGTDLDVGTTFTLTCPPGGTPGPVWGTGPYSDDSALCTAAVHFGRITVSEGGTVGGTKGEPVGSFSGGTSNGITSQALDAERGTIEFY